MVLLAGCKKEKTISLNVLSKSIAVKETYAIPAKCDGPITYKSMNEYAAQVTQDGLLTGRHYTGKTTQIVLTSEDDTKSFTVEVAPRSTLYTEPRFDFGHPRSTYSPGLTLVQSSDNANLYNFSVGGEGTYLMVMFDAADKVSGYSILVPIRMKSQLEVFLEDRYEYVGLSDDGYNLYINALKAADATMIVGIDYFSSSGWTYWLADYIPYSNKGKGDGSDAEDIRKCLEEFMLSGK